MPDRDSKVHAQIPKPFISSHLRPWCSDAGAALQLQVQEHDCGRRGLFYAPGMEHPSAIRPETRAVFHPEKMGKVTLFRSDRLMVGLNAFEPGQQHALHAHEAMDKVYYVLEGEGIFLLEGQELPMQQGVMLVAPEGVPHGIRNTGEARLVVLAVLAPSP
jgi:quercetin dioxygenase-like cupin family protein